MKDKEQHTEKEFLNEETLLLYKAGKLSSADMRKVERLLEKYPLYADALEGLMLLEDSKAQTNIASLREYAEKQAQAMPTARIIPLRKNYLMRVAVAIVILLVSLGGFYAFYNQFGQSESAGTIAMNNEPEASPRGAANGATPPQNEEAEAGNRQDVSSQNQSLETARARNSSTTKQEALVDTKSSKNLKPTDIVADTIQTLALSEKQKHILEEKMESSESYDAEAITEKKAEEEKPTVVIAPAPIQQSANDDQKVKDVANNKDRNTNSNNNKDLDKRDEIKESKKMSVAKKRKEQQKEESPSSTYSASGKIASGEEALKNTLRQQILDLAKAQNETPKGKLIAKITFTKEGKIDKVSIQEMPCKSCKTDILIKTIEQHQFADAKEKNIEITF